MKTTKLLAFAALATMLLGSCGKKGNPETQLDYMAVQMSKGDNWSIIDKNGKEVVKEEYPADASISEIRDGVFWVKQGDKYQLFSVDSPKKPVTDEEFTRVTVFHGGVSAVSSPNKPIRIINTSGKTIATLPNHIKRCYTFSTNGYAVISNTDNKEGLLDSKGNIILEPKYSGVFFESDGVVLVVEKDDDKTIQIIDTKGKKQGEINKEKYTPVSYHYNEGKLLVHTAEYDESTPLTVLDKRGEKMFTIKKSSAKYSCGQYIDGYLTFRNAEGKWGVADDKGETVIRPKYETMANLGEGLFIAEKNEKAGVIDNKDEIVLDFDYEDGAPIRIGHNFLMLDGGTATLVGKDGKEIIDFDNADASDCNSYAEYVDVEGLMANVTKTLVEMSEPKTAAQACSAGGLGLDDAHYKSSITTNVDYDGKISMEYYTYFSDYIAEEKTHTEEINDGWFTSTRTVSDGWEWSDAVVSRIRGTISFNNLDISPKNFCDAVLDKIAANGYRKVDDNVYSKNMKLGDNTLESRITLTPDDDSISLIIDFNE